MVMEYKASNNPGLASASTWLWRKYIATKKQDLNIDTIATSQCGFVIIYLCFMPLRFACTVWHVLLLTVLQANHTCMFPYF